MRQTVELVLGDLPGADDNDLFFTWGTPYNNSGPWYPNPTTAPVQEVDAIQQIRGTIKIYTAAP